MDLIEYTCKVEKEFCINCSNHFRAIRPKITSIIVTKNFKRDFKDDGKAESIIRKIMECSNLDFSELHKFEEKIGNNLIFRAKEGDLHIVYGIGSNNRIVFLRAIRNFNDYKKFLANKTGIVTLIQNS
jgi:mRNA-degrading endonuclease RelE of RelBE toxin-antitoxin system